MEPMLRETVGAALEAGKKKRSPSLAEHAQECFDRGVGCDGFTPGTFADECYRLLGELGQDWLLLQLPSAPETSRTGDLKTVAAVFAVGETEKIQSSGLSDDSSVFYAFPADVTRPTFKTLDRLLRERTSICGSPEKHARFSADPARRIDSAERWLLSTHGNVHSVHFSALATPEVVESLAAENPGSCLCELFSESEESQEKLVAHVWTEEFYEEPELAREELQSDYLVGWNRAHRPEPNPLSFPPGEGLRACIQRVVDRIRAVEFARTQNALLRSCELEEACHEFEGVLSEFGTSDAYVFAQTCEVEGLPKLVKVGFPIESNRESWNELKRMHRKAFCKSLPAADEETSSVSFSSAWGHVCPCGKPVFPRFYPSHTEGHVANLLGSVPLSKRESARGRYPKGVFNDERGLSAKEGAEGVELLPESARIATPKELNRRAAGVSCFMSLLDSKAKLLSFLASSVESSQQ